MIVLLFKTSRMYSTTLPLRIKGQYWVSDTDSRGQSRKLFRIEAEDDKWILKSSKLAWIAGEDGSRRESCPLTAGLYLYVQIAGESGHYVLYTEDVDATRQTLNKIVVSRPDVFSIGRQPNNNFAYDNPFVSGTHARLSFDGSSWSISDNNSTNGTFVNGERIQSKKLNAGDLIYIMGLKMVVGDRFVAVNNPDMRLSIRSDALSVYRPEKAVSTEVKDEEPDYFLRSPRFVREVEHEELTIDPPPAPTKVDSVPLALMIGPSMTMGLTAVGTGIISVMNVTANGGKIMQALPTLIMAFSMLLGTVLWPILTKKYEKKQKIKAEKERQEKYLAYLNDVSDEIRRIGKEQESILRESMPKPSECVERIIRRQPTLWERAYGQPDFLKLRIGVGNLPMDLEVKYQPKKFTMDDDTLQNAMLSLAEQPKELRGVPIGFSLLADPFVGLCGGAWATSNMLKNLLLQMIAYHSYNELKVILVTDEEHAKEWEFIRYIPHFWNKDRSLRFFVNSQDDLKEVSAFLETEVLIRAEKEHANELVPHYVMMATDSRLLRKCEAVTKILETERSLGFSLLLCSDKISEFPKETSLVINTDNEHSSLIDKNANSFESQEFAADIFNDSEADEIGRAIADVQLDLSSTNYTLPSMLTFLEMFGVGKVEHLNSLTRWKDNNPVKTLQTPIGVDTYGDNFYLDLHEKFHGPHGLVAGMTGSGKSEFIITYILSLAVNFHPDEVAFILIDYKGGGLAGAFEDPERGIKLPHLAGTITNLDGAAIKRSLISIQSELRRRQALFNKARRIANSGTIDIYKYQQMYRDKLVDEPCPHLFIISDEFAELKAQQPEFMEQLISAARIGRSLGVHLILATQKPSGVVDDQIWSNSRFRVCLKVQEKADSEDMIKRPDAAALSQTGRFYLQVGFNELFALGQSAWCGADYIPKEVVEKAVDTSIQVIDNMGRVVLNVKPAEKEKKKGDTKQIVAIVNYLSELAGEEHITERSLWLPPIPAKIYPEALEAKYGWSKQPFVLEPVIGEYDDPFNQAQALFTVPISRDGNCLVYGSTGNGKTTFLTTLCYQLIRHYSPEEVSIYIVDFGSETLKAFEKAPQVGGVVLAAEEEKMINLLKLLKKEIDERRLVFSEYGGDYASYIRTGRTDKPNIVVMLNNFSVFTELYEDYQDDFMILSRDGVKYGIYFVVTAGSTNAVRYRTQQNFKFMLTMQLNDPTDYPIIVGKTDGLIPSRFKGRGLVALDKVYEFQTAYCTDQDDQLEFIRNFSAEAAKNTVHRAKPIPVLPDVVDFDFVSEAAGSLKAVPTGVIKSSLELACIDLTANVVYPVLGQEIALSAPFMNGLIRVLKTCSKVSVIDTENVLSGKNSIPAAEYESFIQELFADMVARNNAYKDAGMDVSALAGFAERTIVIVGFKKLFDKLSEDSADKLFTLIDKAEAFYGIHFVITDVPGQIKTLCMDMRLRHQMPDSDGIWIGEGIADQYSIKLNKVTNDLYEELEDGYGYQITRGRQKLIKLLSETEE